MPARKRRPSPARTPVTVTVSYPNAKTGKTVDECAESAERASDGTPLWTYTRTGHREWEARRHGFTNGFVLARTLEEAAELTASGHALKVIEKQEAELAATLAAVKAGAR